VDSEVKTACNVYANTSVSQLLITGGGSVNIMGNYELDISDSLSIDSKSAINCTGSSLSFPLFSFLGYWEARCECSLVALLITSSGNCTIKVGIPEALATSVSISGKLSGFQTLNISSKSIIFNPSTQINIQSAQVSIFFEKQIMLTISSRKHT
jgi:hypothetical protein